MPPSPDPAPSAGPDSSAAPTPIDLVRARFPDTPEEDAAPLAAQATLLAELRAPVDPSLLDGADPALVFDPRQGAS